MTRMRREMKLIWMREYRWNSNVLRDIMWRMYVEFAYYGLIKSWVEHMAIVHVLFVATLLSILVVIHFLWRRGPEMATLFGRVDTFEENTETWKHYTERPGHYFDANIMVLCTSQIEASTSPRATPWAFEFLENRCSNSPLPGLKSCSNAPTRTCLRGRSWGLFHWQRLVIAPKKILFIL